MKHLLQYFFLLVSNCVFSQNLPNPVMFCTQVPFHYGFGTSMDTFGNHLADTYSAPRGGDLYIRYTDGSLKNLTQAAGYGSSGFQGANSIAVRDPSVHWSGTKAVFSMVIGSAVNQYQIQSYNWKLYEITGLGKNDTPIITLVPNQPSGYNNVQPIYGTDDRIIFASDMPRGGIAHLYPQHDEYESSAIVSGLWKLDPNACSISSGLEMLTHSPSGDFTPIIDHSGRLVFTRWDHLQRDQQADGDFTDYTFNGTFTYNDESENAAKTELALYDEIFPEPRPGRNDLLALPQWANTNPQNFNIFNPWMMNEDGTELEMLNHVGRHEMGNYMTQNFTNDNNLTDFYTPISPTPIRAMFHIQESPVTPGLYYGIEAPEFGTHGAGMVVSVNAPPGTHPEDIIFTYITHPETRNPDPSPSTNHSGLYRNPLPLSDGQVIASHSTFTNYDSDDDPGPNYIKSKYEFRIRKLEPNGSYLGGNTPITGAGISKSIVWWSPDEELRFEGILWESYPVEVKPRPKPTNPTLSLENVAPSEQALFAAAGVNLHDFRKFLRRNDLSVLAIRDVTSRDDADHQQPFNLKVAGTLHQTVNPETPSPVYEVKHLQFLQNDQIRGNGGIESPTPGRRGLARFLHDPKAMLYNTPSTGSQGSTNIHPDGSAAMVVPAQRALTWQLTDVNNKGIVRERLWLSTKPGEVRTCTSCRGESTLNQAGNTSPSNAPQALTTLLNHIKNIDTDNDGIKDIYDAYPSDLAKHISEPVNEKFINNLSNFINQNPDNDAVTWTTLSTNCHNNSSVINNRTIDNSGKIDRLIRTLDLSNMDYAKLTFDVAYARYDALKFDRLRVYVKFCNGTEQLVYNKAGSQLATSPDQTTMFQPINCNQWRTETVDLSAFVGKTVQLIFEDVGGWGNQLFLDNILVQELEVCPNNQTVSGNLTSGNYMAITNVSTQNLAQTEVVSGSNVNFRGGNSVTLLPAFQVQSGAKFKAEIGGCQD